MAYKTDILNNNRDILSPNTIVNTRMQMVFNSNKSNNKMNSGYWEDDYYYTHNVHTMRLSRDLLYRLNKQGFRCNNFKPVDKKKFTVLYSGCSVTFGQDLPEEMLWTKLITKELSKNKDVEEYNLSIMGGSIFLTLSNICAFINTYGMPDLIIALMPDITRTVTFDPVTSEFFDLTPRTQKPDAKNFVDQLMPENLLLNNLLMLKLLEVLCKNAGSKFLVSTYDGLTDDCFSMFANDLDCWFDSKNLISGPRSVKQDYEEHESPYWKIAGDGRHPGGGWHERFAKRVLEVL